VLNDQQQQQQKSTKSTKQKQMKKTNLNVILKKSFKIMD